MGCCKPHVIQGNVTLFGIKLFFTYQIRYRVTKASALEHHFISFVMHRFVNFLFLLCQIKQQSEMPRRIRWNQTLDVHRGSTFIT